MRILAQIINAIKPISTDLGTYLSNPPRIDLYIRGYNAIFATLLISVKMQQHIMIVLLYESLNEYLVDVLTYERYKSLTE